jgi:hypothetical protein
MLISAHLVKLAADQPEGYALSSAERQGFGHLSPDLTKRCEQAEHDAC